MPKLRDLPPPITKNSTRNEMWEEIQSLRREIDSQQQDLLESRNLLNKAADTIDMLKQEQSLDRMRLNVIRAALQ